MRALRDTGVLVIGSGYMTHGLPFLDWTHPDKVPAWSVDFNLWTKDALARGDLDALSDFRAQAPDALRPPHRGAPHPAVRHARRRLRPVGAATTVIDGLRQRLGQTLVPGCLTYRLPASHQPSETT